MEDVAQWESSNRYRLVADPRDAWEYVIICDIV